MQNVSKRRVPLSPLAFSALSAARQMFPDHGDWSVDDIDGNPYGVRLSDGKVMVDIFLIVKMADTWADFSPGTSPIASQAAQICRLFRGVGTELPQRRWFTKHQAILGSDHDISLED